jgi:alkylation response protein AidB-like acyl-CoA dehydrogenase
MSVISTGILPTTTLETFRSRAAGYDRENRFFQEDFDDLRQAGYLRMAVPKELGGLGFLLADVARKTKKPRKLQLQPLRSA